MCTRRVARALTLFGVLAAAACGWPGRPTGAVPPLREECAVYSIALHRVFTEDSQSASLRVVRTTTVPVSFDGSYERRLRDDRAHALAGLKDETIRSFVERNRGHSTLPEPLSPGMPYSWVSNEDFLSRKAMANVRPDGRIDRLAVLSAAGYDRAHTQALVYVVDACPLCGHAEYVLLTRTPLGWAVTAQADDWWS